MSLLGKVRTLVGALVHKPFMPRPEKVALDDGSEGQVESAARREQSALEEPGPEAEDRQRVADLIAQQKETAD